LRLAQLHSDAVDFPKNGQPVDPRQIPKLHFDAKPDWDAPEIKRAKESKDYYPSTKAVGHLFRSLRLPERPTTQQRRHVLRPMENQDPTSASGDVLQDPIYSAVRSRVGEFIDVSETTSPDEETKRFFDSFAYEMGHACMRHTISSRRVNILPEEEALVGTILARTPQRKYRQKLISSLREHTTGLVKYLRSEFENREYADEHGRLRFAWGAFTLSVDEMKHETFGAKSFWWISLGEIFDCIKEIEAE